MFLNHSYKVLGDHTTKNEMPYVRKKVWKTFYTRIDGKLLTDCEACVPLLDVC